MIGDSSLDLLAFNLKLAGKKTRKNILVSAGRREQKDRLLNVIEKISKLNVDLYATPGTSDYFNKNG